MEKHTSIWQLLFFFRTMRSARVACTGADGIGQKSTDLVKACRVAVRVAHGAGSPRDRKRYLGQAALEQLLSRRRRCRSCVRHPDPETSQDLFCPWQRSTEVESKAVGIDLSNVGDALDQERISLVDM